MELRLTPEEHELLTEVLEERRRELLHEISRTDHHAFRIILRKKQKLMESVLDKLAQDVCDYKKACA
jgi:hypothetical protein